jgi:DNA gyrase subunit A
MPDQVRVIRAFTTDERFVPAETPPLQEDVPAGPYLLAVTAQGQVVCTPLAAFRIASTRVGRRYIRLNEDDRVVMVDVITDQQTMFLVSQKGHVLHFPVAEINVISSAGKGVLGIKLADRDVCIGGLVMTRKRDKMLVETSGGKTMEFGAGKETTSRGGKGFEAVKRTSFVRVIPPPLELADWDAVEARADKTKAETNGEQRSLFE